MEKTMKTSEVVDAYSALKDFAEKDIELSAQAAWDIEDNLEELKKINDKFEKHRDELITPLNEKGAFFQQGENIGVKKEFEEEFLEANDKLNEFLDIDNKLEIKMISKNDLPEKISIKDLKALRFMISNE